MRTNRSPWLHQLNPDRVPQRLTKDTGADVVIVGAGIAGISTAYFLLTRTDKRVIVIEAGKLAHGATGHNAGQVVSYFERGFASLVESFGLDMAAAGQKDVEDAWPLLDEMYRVAGLDIPFHRFLGHAGLTSLEQVILHLRNNELRVAGGLEHEEIRIADDAPFLADIPPAYAPLYRIVPRAEVRRLLETEMDAYVAVLSYQKGVLNSALFCQEMVAWFMRNHRERFALYEHAPVQKVLLRADGALLDCGEHVVAAQRVVLCTNGFENFHVINEGGLAVDARFHNLVFGTVGYMSAYLEPENKEPVAISYLENPSADTSLSYFYLTRRPYELEGTRNLISIGGPCFDIEDTREYRADHEFPDSVVREIDRFARATYDPDPNKDIDYRFTWHGLMGYTRNGVRLVGTEPRNPVLLYNLGCNGIGILPSIHGGSRIADLIAGKRLPVSIFDVPDNEALTSILDN